MTIIQNSENFVKRSEAEKALEAADASTQASDPTGLFSENTSLHGVRYVISGSLYSRAVPRRAAWTALLGVLAGFCAALLVVTVYQYFQYDSVTRISQEVTDAVDFPAVTICPLNAYKDTLGESTFVKYTTMQNDPNSTFNTNETYKEIIINELKQTDFATFYAEYAHSVHEVMVSCKFQNTFFPCEIADSLLAENGQCFTFNSEQFIRKNGSLKVSNPGYVYGLQLVLDLHSDAIPTNSDVVGSGFFALIHDPYVYPLVREKGFLVSPKVQTFVAVDKQIQQLLSTPYSRTECLNNPDDYFPNEAYSKELCEFDCWINLNYDNRCTFLPNSQLRQCNLYDTAFTYNSTNNVSINPNELFTQCSCLPKCESTIFDYSVTTSVISDTNLLHFAQNNWDHTNITYAKNNYVFLNVFYDSLDYKLVVQSPALSFNGVLSDIGGLLGVFMGASIITIVEVLEYVFELLRFRFGKNAKIKAIQH